jgi:hypothetical protein
MDAQLVDNKFAYSAQDQYVRREFDSLDRLHLYHRLKERATQPFDNTLLMNRQWPIPTTFALFSFG